MSGGKVVAWVGPTGRKMLARGDERVTVSGRERGSYLTPLVLQSDLAAAIARAEAAEARLDFLLGRMTEASLNDLLGGGYRMIFTTLCAKSAIDAAIAAQQAEGEA